MGFFKKNKPSANLEGAEIKNAISECRKNPEESQAIQTLLKLFVKGSLWVPMNSVLSEEDRQRLLSAKQGDKLSFDQPARFKPDILKTDDGALFFPAFSSKEEANPDYRRSFSWLPMLGLDIIDAALHNNELSGVVINAFSEPYVINRKIMQIITGSAVSENAIEKDDIINLVPLGGDFKKLYDEAIQEFVSDGRVRKAFVSKMFRNRKFESILFVIDGDFDNQQEYFGKLHLQMKKLGYDLSFDYAAYPSFGKQLNDSPIFPFYAKDGYGQKVLNTYLDRYEMLNYSEFRDDNGWLIKITLDYKSSDEFSTVIYGSEAIRLMFELAKELNAQEYNIPELISNYLGCKAFNIEQIPTEIINMLNKFDVSYRIARA